jgi:spermidine synthase
MRAVLLLLLLLSGAAGLVYEVAWTRRLVLILGNSTHAVAAILASFMLGLALGSWWLGRRADRMRRPVAVYGLLEAGIGVYALVFPWLIDNVVTAFYVSLGPATGTSYAVKFALAFLLLLVPATLMGGTLPILIRWATESLRGIGGRVGIFYGANTFGAVLGCFLAGYVLIEQVGVTGATRVAAAANLVVAAVAILLGRLTPVSEPAPVAAESPPEEGQEIPPSLVRRTAAAFLVSGFCALALEVLWTRMLVFFLQGFTWAFTAMLTTFLFGLAFGAAALGRVVNRVRHPVRFLGGLLVAIAFASAGAQALLREMFGIWDALRDRVVADWGVPYRYGLFAGTFLILLVPTFLMGGVFPTVSRVVARRLDDVGRSIGWVYALNTVGAVLGSLAAGLVLVPLVGMQWAVLLVVSLAGILGLWVLGAPRRSWPVTVGLGAVLAVVIVLATKPTEPFILRSHVFRGPLGSSRELLDYREGPICAVSVVEDRVTGFRTLYTDEFAAAATGDHYRYMRMLGHLPLLLSPEREDVLVIAFGTGTTAGSVSVHADVERLDVVEISQEVFDVAPFFSKVNRDVLADDSGPEVVPYVMDGRNFVLTTDRRYDVVSLEPLMPYTPAAVNLYTKEFYEICRRTLKPGGVMCQWIPIHAMSADHYKMLVRSFVDVFPDSSVWFFETTSAIVGRTEPGPMRHDRLAARAAEEGVAADLREIGLDDAEAVLSCFVTGGEELVRLVSDVAPMTDEHPTLEYHPVGYGALNSFFADNLAVFHQAARPVIDGLDTERLGPDPLAVRAELAVRHARFRDFLAARHHREAWLFFTNLGNHRQAAIHLREAVRLYDRALEHGPDLPDPVIERYREGARYALLVFTALGHAEAGQTTEAIELLRTATKLSPPETPHQAWFHLGRIQAAGGRYGEAVSALRRACELHPGRPEYRDALAKAEAHLETAGVEVAEEARRLLAAVLDGTAGSGALARLREMRGSTTGLAGLLEEDLRRAEAALLEATDDATRARALKAILSLEPAWLQEALAAAVAHPDAGPGLRTFAARSAARRPGHEHLLERLEKGDLETRRIVARALAETRPPDAARALLGALEDEDGEVRLQAFLALHGITGKELGYDPEAPIEERRTAVARWRAYVEQREGGER